MTNKTYIIILITLFVTTLISGQTKTETASESGSVTKAKYSILGDYHHTSLDTVETTPQFLPEVVRELEKNSKKNSNESSQKQPSFSGISRNTMLSVGTTNGIANVSATGAATYQIPIETPKGVGEFKPSISITYNSQSNYGLLGFGWNLSALSSISRCGKSFYYDNAATEPQLSNTDNLMLDGGRLLLVSGTNLTNGAKYKMEYDHTVDITYKIMNSYPVFVVKSKDGTIREYGSTANSNIETSSGTTMLWLLSKVTDLNGNTMNYSYSEVLYNGECYLDKITYAGNRSVQFSYETRYDAKKTYFAGNVTNCNKRLSKITTYIGTTMIKEYAFTYNSNGIYSKLIEVKEKGQNNAQYNPIVIDYAGSESWENEYFSSLSENREGVTPLFGDFNGDGKMDFFSYPTKSSYTTNDKGTLYLSHSLYGDIYFSKQSTIPVQFEYGVFQGFTLADLNGDGKMDVVNISKALNGTYRYNFYFFDGVNLTQSGGFNTDGKDAFVGDFNGDGKHELLIKSNQKVFNGSGVQIASGGIDNWGDDYITQYYPNSRYLSDFNGNGKTDILAINASGAWVYELNGSSFTKLTSFNTSDIRNYYFPYFADFNGDGLSDVLIQRNTGVTYDDVSILYSTGKGFVKQSITGADIRAKVMVGDFNQDGRSDIFHMEVVNNALRMKVGTFNGTSFQTAYYTTFLRPEDFQIPYNPNNPYNTGIQYENYLFQVADFDGDGRAELCNAKYVDTYIMHAFTDNSNLLAKKITDGLGMSTFFQYMPITDASCCSRTNTPVFPASNSLFPLYVATSMEQSANGYTDYTSFYYKNPVVHRQGKGFICFEEIEQSNTYQDKKAVSKYKYDNTYFYPYVSEQIITTKTSGSNISTSVFEYLNLYQGPKRITPYLKKQTETDHLTGVIKTVECQQIDSWGSPKKVVTKYGSDVTETVTSNYADHAIDNLWLIGLPTTTEKSITKGSDNWIEKQTFTYNTSNLLEKAIYFTGDGTRKVSEVRYTHDGYGNVTSKSTLAYASTNILTEYFAYSPDGVFHTNVTGPTPSIHTTYAYNSLGQLSSSIDLFGKTTSFIYDDMGRLTRTNHDDGSFSTTTFSWDNSVTYGVFCKTTSSSGAPTEKIYFDALSRELRNTVTRFDNSEIRTDKKYNNAGQLYQESLPYKSSSYIRWNTYNFDTYGRVTQINFASGKTNSFSYSGNRVAETTNGITSTKFYNAKGELIKVTDPAGEIIYTLRPDGQPVTIVAPGNVTTSFGYDNYGRKTSINDPSAGIITYKYDNAGRLNEETDANGKIKKMSYDNYGLLRTREFTEFSTTYDYYDNHLLKSEVSTNGTSHSYTYDAFGRLQKERDQAPDSKWLEKTYTYTSTGNLSSVQFTSQSGSIGTEIYSYANGHMSEIKLGTTSIWKLNEENALGIPVSVTTGPVTRTYSYNDFGIPTGRTASSNFNGIFQNETYGFDTGRENLTYRTDRRRNIQENFTYDNLNRLKTFAGVTMEYDIKGNITQKGDIGTVYAYEHPTKPYAVTGINANSNVPVSQREQSVTYTSFERPAGITENNCEAIFTYDGLGDRKKMQIRHNGNVLYQRYYLGNRYELDVRAAYDRQKLYLGGDAYTAPAVLVNEGNYWNFYYICRDYLGSMTHLVSSTGTLAYEYSFDAWGRLRDPASRQVYAPDSEPTLFLDRGYTGHEHLPLFDVINMNARLYDPAIGRFLSPDPFVQASDFSQNYNRYSYCMNNPLVYKDKNGEWANIVIGAIIGGFTNLMMNIDNVDNAGQFFGYFGVGAAAGALGGWAGGAVSSALGAASTFGGAIANGALSGGAAGLSSGFVGGAGNAWIGGANFGQGLHAGINSGAIGALSGALTGGVAGGIRYQRQNFIFRKSLSELGVNAEDAVPATDDFLNRAQKAWYKDAPMDKIKVFTVENVPLKAQEAMDANKAMATTSFLSREGKLTGMSSVYFNKHSAFSSAKELFYSMGHEFVHVSQYAALAGEFAKDVKTLEFKAMLDYHAYNYQNSIGGTVLNGFTEAEIRSATTTYSYLGFMNFSWTFNHSFKYPF